MQQEVQEVQKEVEPNPQPQPKEQQKNYPPITLNAEQNNETLMPNENAMIIKLPNQINDEVVNVKENQVAIADVPIVPALPN